MFIPCKAFVTYQKFNEYVLGQFVAWEVTTKRKQAIVDALVRITDISEGYFLKKWSIYLHKTCNIYYFFYFVGSFDYLLIENNLVQFFQHYRTG